MRRGERQGDAALYPAQGKESRSDGRLEELLVMIGGGLALGLHCSPLPEPGVRAAGSMSTATPP